MKNPDQGPGFGPAAWRKALSAERKIWKLRNSGIADLEFGLWEQDLTLDVYTVAYLSLAVLSGILALKHYSSNDP